jgi:hypothetical protein
VKPKLNVGSALTIRIQLSVLNQTKTSLAARVVEAGISELAAGLAEEVNEAVRYYLAWHH